MNNIPSIVGIFTNNSINDITNNLQLFQCSASAPHTTSLTRQGQNLFAAVDFKKVQGIPCGLQPDWAIYMRVIPHAQNHHPIVYT